MKIFEHLKTEGMNEKSNKYLKTEWDIFKILESNLTR